MNHKEILAANEISSGLNVALTTIILTLVDYIKMRPLKSKLICAFYQMMYSVSLYYSEANWLLRAKFYTACL